MKVADSGKDPGFKNISMSSTNSTKAFRLNHLEGYSAAVKWAESSAPLVGTMKIEISNNAFDQADNEDPNADWEELAGSAVAVNGSDSFFYIVEDAYYKAFRITFEHTSGDGTFDAEVHAQGHI